jgi:hypothetical protein
MTAAMLVLEPIFEADLPPEQYAYSGVSAQDRLVRPSVRPLQTQGGAYLFALADVLTQHRETLTRLTPAGFACLPNG